MLQLCLISGYYMKLGCTWAQVENVELVPPHSIRFDFLGKDSIRYENTVEVDQRVYNNGEGNRTPNLQNMLFCDAWNFRHKQRGFSA